MRMLQSRLSFWRIALWGSVTILAFSVTFRHLFDAAISVALVKRHAENAGVPSPLSPIIASIAASILAAALGVIGASKIRALRGRGNDKHSLEHVDLAIRVLLLIVALALAAGLPQSRLIVTGRCSLFTVNFACGRYHGLPTDGAYDFTDGAGRHSGIYQDVRADANVQVRRTRFGWPFKTITRDVNTNAHEWHVTFEGFYLAVGNIFICFLGWLFLNAIANLARRFLQSWQ